MYLVFLLHDRSLICKFSIQKVLGAGYLNTNRPFFGVVVLVFFYAYSSPYALRLLCFALFPRLSPWQPWQLGTPAKVLPLFYLLGRFERIKTVLMGTNTPHTFIPGLVWQKRAHPFSQFELKVGVTRISLSLCMRYRGIIPQGARGRHFFPLGKYGPLAFFALSLFWIKRTLFRTYLFSFPFRARNNRVSLFFFLVMLWFLFVFSRILR